MLRRKLSRVQYGIVLLMLAGFTLGLVAVVGDSISSYLTFTIGQPPEPTYWEFLVEVNGPDQLPTVYTQSNVYYAFTTDTGGYIIFWWNGTTLEVLQNQNITLSYATTGASPTYLIRTNSNGQALHDGANGNIYYVYYDGVWLNATITPVKAYMWNGTGVPTSPPSATPTSDSITLSLGFVVNVVLAFAGIYMLVKGIYYIGGVKV